MRASVFLATVIRLKTCRGNRLAASTVDALPSPQIVLVTKKIPVVRHDPFPGRVAVNR